MTFDNSNFRKNYSRNTLTPAEKVNKLPVYSEYKKKNTLNCTSCVRRDIGIPCKRRTQLGVGSRSSLKYRRKLTIYSFTAKQIDHPTSCRQFHLLGLCWTILRIIKGICYKQSRPLSRLNECDEKIAVRIACLRSGIRNPHLRNTN
jgi:hypothetical protein